MPDGAEIQPFLGIGRSFGGRLWRERLEPDARRAALAIAEANGLTELTARVLAGRGVRPEDTADFLNPSLRTAMPDPSVLQGMDAAAERLAGAIERGEKVGIFGDYDVDGACSSALLKRYLAIFGMDAPIHIPDRIGEGYGPNTPAIDTLKGEGVSLLVTVDCGTVSHEALGHAAAIGLETLVFDHHLAGEALPPAIAVVNPNRADDISGLGMLCAAGVTFMVLVATNRELRRRGRDSALLPDLMQWLDLVALATVCDVVPLTGLNRAFVARGLEIVTRRINPGIAALSEAGRVSGPASPYHLGFVLGPRINAGGRVGDSALGARLLSSDDPAETGRIAMRLDMLNRERQALEQAAVAEALEEAEGRLAQADAAVLVLASEGWHPGVVGLVAARLKERFHRPAIAIAVDPDGLGGTGSGRSIPGVDLGRAIRAAVDEGLLVKGGGHVMAAGLTVEMARLAAFRDWISARLADDVAANGDRQLLVDGALDAGGATLDAVRELSRAEPFGSGNPEPVIVFPAHRLVFADETPQGHIRLRIAGQGATPLSGIAFRASGTPLGAALLDGRGRAMHFAGTLRIDRWQGRETVSLHVRDAAAV
ncbi:MAG: single-stranded-DNA-specific exonuclease RecJ [Rhodobiaceae bacterium]|nr:single-stranded-DNA-specific exonuclease RecJ [Rhodobiaceae bacterium]MCC0057108.1 single-stranded-DNA-specific exonuclease RecJ [Rhodobiaceae bacterium]